MYKLLGADQKEYGPVSADQIRAWIAQGRANAKSQLQAAGSTEWKPLADFPEFAAALQPASGAPPSAPAGAPPKTSRLAVTSLVLGCLGLLTCGVSALVGLVLGIVAMVRINKSQGRLGGHGLALAGTVVSLAFLLLAPIPVAILIPALAKAKDRAAQVKCLNNVKQLNLALIMYATDNNELLPAGTNWCDVLRPYLAQATNVFVCPLGASSHRCHYAFNAKLAGRPTTDIQNPAHTVLIFETDGGWNLSGGRELHPARARHSGGTLVVGYADGHAAVVPRARLNQLVWGP